MGVPGLQQFPGVCRLAAAVAVVGLAAASDARAAAGVPVGPLAAGVLGQDSYGTIKGRLVYGGEKAPEPKILVEKGKASKDPSICAVSKSLVDENLVVDPKSKGIKYAIVFLVKPKGDNPEAVKALVSKTPKVEIDQKDCEFIPYTTALHQDQTLVFKSSDPTNHNVHLTPFTNAPVNQILPPDGQMEKKLVAERRVIPLVCDIHPWMKGYVMVFDHPFFAVTGDDGTFEIKGVPAGEQNLVIWQSAVGYVTPGALKGTPVKVTAGKATDAGDFKLDPSKVKPGS